MMHEKRPATGTLYWIIFGFLISAVASGASGAPILHEFLASNTAEGFLDEDGAASDWIEIYNPDDVSVDLGDYALSDDAENLTKWRFPKASVLPAQQYMVVFASGKDRAVSGSELHTNFSLSAKAGSILLTAPDGTSTVSIIESYPEQRSGVSYGVGVSGATFRSTPVVQGASCRWWVPDEDIGKDWQSPGFDDTGWASGLTGIGFGYEGLTGEGGDVQSAMKAKNASIYVRVPFELSDPGVVVSVKLRMKYEDGFVAYLNGKKVAAQNAPEPAVWNAKSTATHKDSDAVVFEEFSLAFADSLVVGENILAFHGMNSSSGGSDLLILPELEIEERKGESALGFFLTPTPGMVNASRIDGFVGAVGFEQTRGFYDAPFDLKMSTSTVGATVRFTTDGSVPTEENGTTYEAPIRMDSTTVLRAAAFRGGWEPTKVGTQTYIFLDDVLTQSVVRAGEKGFPSSWRGTAVDYDMDRDIVNDPDFGPQLIPALKKIPTISLVTSADDLFGREGVYSNPDRTGVNWERPISMEIIDSETGDSHQTDCGVRSQGGAFRSFSLTKKKSLRLLFKGIYGDTKLRYPMFGTGGGVVEEFDTLTLRMEANDGWQWDGAGGQPQYARDEFGRRTQLALGQPSGHGRSVHLYLNGFYWGVYNLVERPDAGFAEAYFDVPKENWDGINTGGGINGGSNRPWRDLLTLTRAIRSSDTEAERTAAYYKVMGLKPDGTNDPELESFLDAENFVDYLLVNWYMGNTDWPHNNYYCGRGQGLDSEGYKFFMWDAEWTLFIGGGISSNQTGNVAGVAEPQRGLRNSLEYRMLFADRAHRALFNDGPLTSEACADRYDGFVKDHPLILIAESARWGDQHRSSRPRTTDDWQREYNRIKNTWFPRRTDTFISQLRRANLYPEVDPPVLSQRGGEVPVGFELTMTESDRGVIYYTLDGSDPRLPVLGDTSAQEMEFVAENALRSFRVPLSAEDGFTSSGIAWNSPDFVEPDDWTPTVGPVGFENGGGGYAALVELDLRPLMQAKSAAVLVRIPFLLTQLQLDDLDFLNLEAKYDDGFVAYINGIRVASANAPEVVNGESVATDNRRDADAVIFEKFGASAAVPALRPGENVLAIIGLNRSSGGSDFFNSVRLTGGADQTISRSAEVYSGPIGLDQSLVVKARVLSGEEWSALEEAVFLVGTEPAAQSNLVVSEFSYRPPMPSSAEIEAGVDSRNHFEFIELTNIGALPVSLAGVTLSPGVTFSFADTDTIPKGGSVLLVGDRDGFLMRYGRALESLIAGRFNGKLNNGGESIALHDAEANVIQSFTYSGSVPWPQGDQDAGFSLELIAPATNPDPDKPTNWRVSSAPLGTPGRVGDSPGFVGDPLADADGDGLTALLEYALGTPDTDANQGSGVVSLSQDPGNDDALLFQFQVNGAASDVAFHVEGSDHLANWVDAGAELISDLPDAIGGTRTRTYSVPRSGKRNLFVRLRVALVNQ
jgi:hypothetical protein